jgi:plasmid stabilization system protein ParE
MKYLIHVTTMAVADTELIREFIAQSSESAVERTLQMLEAACQSLIDFPKRCPVAPESARNTVEIRVMLVGSYRILINVDLSTVHILRIRHASQRPLKPGELN